MARTARKLSPTGYLHLIVRGIGRQVLFEDREDHVYYLSLLRRYSTETEVTVCAYCLMENHVHLLVHDPKGHTPLLMKKLGVCYARHYNRKYERVGHLFQDRYQSEVIEDDGYFLAVYRYILNNPEKAGICRASDYEWSSCCRDNDPEAIADASLLHDLIGDADDYAAFLCEKDDAEYMEFEPRRHDDGWASAIIRKRLKISSGTALQTFEREERNAALRTLKAEGISVRQLERLTGINRGVIQRA